VVTKDVPPFSVVAGNPARVLRRGAAARSGTAAGQTGSRHAERE